MRRHDLAPLTAALIDWRADGPGSVERLQAGCDAARRTYRASACSVAVVEGEHLRYLAAEGAGSGVIVGTELPLDRGIGGFAATTGQALAIDRPTEDDRFARDVAERTGYVPETMLVLPLLGRDGEVLGVLSVLDRDNEPLDPSAPPPPAWSEAFDDVGPSSAPRLDLPTPPTRTWAYGDGRGHGVRVAVVDSGVEADHPLVGGLAGAAEVLVDDGAITTVERPHDDLYGHGTACAGLIRSLAPGVELTSVRVLGPNLRGSAGAFAAGVAWCIEQRFDVVNLSLSTSNPEFLPEFWALIDRAAFARVLLVSAMNNHRMRTIPSELGGVCSVACGPSGDIEQVWCNPASPPEWGAPGIDLAVAWRAGSTTVASGNSLSAAIVTGHLARVVGAHPGITPWQARTVLAAVAANA